MKFLKLLVYRLSLCSNSDTFNYDLHRLHGSLLASLLLTANVVSIKLIVEAIADIQHRLYNDDLAPLPIFLPTAVLIAVIVYFSCGREASYRSLEAKFSKDNSQNWSLETAIVWSYIVASIALLIASVLISI